jgi:hypothetical protein
VTDELQSAGHGGVAGDTATPGAIGGDRYTDAPAPLHSFTANAVVFDGERPARERQTVLREGDAEGGREIAGTAAELVIIGHRLAFAPSRARTSDAHQFDTSDGFERADQHGGWRAFVFGHGIDEIVQAVIEIHVRNAWGPIERLIAPCWPRRGMTRRFADVGLDLDDATRRRTLWRPVNKELAEQIGNHLQRGPGVKVAFENHGPRGGRHGGVRS